MLKLLVVLPGTALVWLTFPYVRSWLSIGAAAALLLFALSGCAAHTHDMPITTNAVFALFGAIIACALVCLFFGGLDDGLRPALVFAAVAVVLFLGGCAALPMPLQPQTEDNSNMAEGAFLVLATVDTVQTMHIRRGTSCDHEADPIAAALYGSKYPKPGRVLVTNLALMTVHTMVASWLDDKVAEAKSRGDDSVGPWYVGRLIFHGASIVAEGAAVANNAAQGCRL